LKLKRLGISEYLWEILCNIQNEKRFESYNLAGGTALGLQLEHRVSTDIDLFTDGELDKDEILASAKRINNNVEILNSSEKVLQILFSDNDPEKILKVDFVSYEYPLLEPLVENEEGIRLVGINDISAMKMSAVGQRGYEARDFVDLYYILKEITMEKIVDNFKRKYKTDNIQHFLRSMNYFEDVSKNSWESIKMIHDRLSTGEVKRKLNDEVNEYWKKQLNPEYKYRTTYI